MIAKLTNEQRNALNQHPDRPLEVEDEETKNTYVLLDASLFYQLLHKEDVASIRRGVEQMEAGQGRPLAEADAEMRQTLGFPPRS